MIAALYGRTKIFFYLVKKKASLQKYDYQNLAVIQYARGPMVRDLVQGYQDIATTGDQPRQRGRHSIYYFLKHANKNSQPRRAQGAQSSETPASVAPPPITIFLRSRDGKQLELMGVQRLATTSVDKDLGRKSTGTVRGKNEAANIYTFAVSGWAGVKGNNVLCNKEYSGLVRRVCSMYGFKLEGSWLDNVGLYTTPLFYEINSIATNDSLLSAMERRPGREERLLPVFSRREAAGHLGTSGVSVSGLGHQGTHG